MAFHWSLKREIHIPDPKKGGGYHCHLLYRGERTGFITCLKIQNGVAFAYLQRHAEGHNPSTNEPDGEKTKRLIGQLTVKELKKISPTGLMIPSAGSEMIYGE